MPADEDAGFQQLWLDPAEHFVVSPPPTSHEGVAGDVEKQVLGASRGVDRIQARVSLVGYLYATFKKYADDEGSRLAALLAYYTFLSLFPLAIAGFAVLNTMLGDNPQIVLDLVDEIVPEEYEQQVIDAYQSLPSGGAALPSPSSACSCPAPRGSSPCTQWSTRSTACPIASGSGSAHAMRGCCCWSS